MTGCTANGLLSLNKPKGMSSCQAVELVKNRLNIPRAGHAGTLDVEACGLLPIGLGKATKIIQFLHMLPKEYKCAMRLGISTDTQDASGRIIKSSPADGLDEDAILKAIGGFRGEIFQVPPAFSALKHRGQRLYNLARKGVYLERSPRRVKVHQIDELCIRLPLVFFRVVCSTGTYIRGLCHDIGEALGVGAHLADLCRTRVGHLSIDESLSPDELQKEHPEYIMAKYIKSIDEALGFLPSLVVRPQALGRAMNGTPLLEDDVNHFEAPMTCGAIFKVMGPKGELLGVAKAVQSQDRCRSDENGLMALKFIKVLANFNLS